MSQTVMEGYPMYVEPEGFELDNPVEVVEEALNNEGYTFERRSAEEILCKFVGHSSTPYTIMWNWYPDEDLLHFGCGFELVVPEERKAELYKLLQHINGQLWIGHFDYFTEHTSGPGIFYRSALPLYNAEAQTSQCVQMHNSGMEECDHYRCAFLLVVQGGKSAEEALECANMIPEGEA